MRPFKRNCIRKRLRQILMVMLALTVLFTAMPAGIFADDAFLSEELFLPEDPDSESVPETEAEDSLFVLDDLPSEDLFPEETEMFLIDGEEIWTKTQEDLIEIAPDPEPEIETDMEEPEELPAEENEMPEPEEFILEEEVSESKEQQMYEEETDEDLLPGETDFFLEEGTEADAGLEEALFAEEFTDLLYSAATPSDGNRYTVLLLDNSGSMGSNNRLSVSKQAAIRFCTQMMAADGKNYVSIVPYASSVVRVYDFTDDLSVLTTQINSMSANGGTNMNAALLQAKSLLSAAPEKANKNIVLLSDGLPESGTTSSSGVYTSSDHSSYYSYGNAVYTTAKSMDSTWNIYTLGFFQGLGGKELSFGRMLMRDIQNHGYYDVTNADDLEFVFDEIFQDILKKIYLESYYKGSAGKKINITAKIEILATGETVNADDLTWELDSSGGTHTWGTAAVTKKDDTHYEIKQTIKVRDCGKYTLTLKYGQDDEASAPLYVTPGKVKNLRAAKDVCGYQSGGNVGAEHRVLKVAWDEVNGAQGYWLEYCDDSSFTGKKIDKGTAVSDTQYAEDKTFEKGIPLYVRVQGYITADGKKWFGDYSDVLTYQICDHLLMEDFWAIKNDANHRIGESYFQMFFTPAQAAAMAQDESANGGIGLCFGLSNSAIAALCRNYPRLSDLGVSSLGNIDTFEKVILARDYIYYTHTLQGEGVYNSRNNLSGFLQKVENYTAHGGLPVDFMVGKVDDNTGVKTDGHNMVALDIVEKSDEEVKIRIYDCNYKNEERFLYLYDDSKSGHYHRWSYGSGLFVMGTLKGSSSVTTLQAGSNNDYLRFMSDGMNDKITAMLADGFGEASYSSGSLHHDDWLLTVSNPNAANTQSFFDYLGNVTVNQWNGTELEITGDDGDPESWERAFWMPARSDGKLVLKSVPAGTKVSLAGNTHSASFETTGECDLTITLPETGKTSLRIQPKEHLEAKAVFMDIDSNGDRRIKTTASAEGNSTAPLVMEKSADGTLKIKGSEKVSYRRESGRKRGGGSIAYHTEVVIDTELDPDEQYRLRAGEGAARVIHVDPDTGADSDVICEVSDHTHSFHTEIVRQPSDTEYGIKIDVCDICGMTTEETFYGKVDTSLSWEMKDGTLYIRGKGEIPYSLNYRNKRFKDFGEPVTGLVIGEGITKIGNDAFYGMDDLVKISLSSTVKEIGDSAFGWCRALETVSCKEGLATIGDKAFRSDFKLKTFKWPKSLRSIGEEAFCFCYGLIKVVLPEGLLEIGQYAFSCCNNLKKLYLPSTLTKVDNTVKGYYYRSSPTSIASIGGGGDAVLYVYRNTLGHEVAKSYEEIMGQFDDGYRVLDPVNIKDCTIMLSQTEYTYDGKEHVPDVTVKIDQETMVQGKDYSFTVKKNVKAGTAKIYFKGKRNLTGKITKSFKIRKKDISTCALVGLNDYVYSGKPCRPKPTVYDDFVSGGNWWSGKELKKGRDYTLTYSDNINAGKAKVVIKGIGNYKGKIRKTFKIRKRNVTFDVKLKNDRFPYTGKNVPLSKIRRGMIVKDEYGERVPVSQLKISLPSRRRAVGTYTAKLTSPNYKIPSYWWPVFEVVPSKVTGIKVSKITSSTSQVKISWNKVKSGAIWYMVRYGFRKNNMYQSTVKAPVTSETISLWGLDWQEQLKKAKYFYISVSAVKKAKDGKYYYGPETVRKIPVG